MKIFEIGGDLSDTNYLFLGDYVDRGCFGIEVCPFFLLPSCLIPHREKTLLRPVLCLHAVLTLPVHPQTLASRSSISSTRKPRMQTSNRILHLPTRMYGLSPCIAFSSPLHFPMCLLVAMRSTHTYMCLAQVFTSTHSQSMTPASSHSARFLSSASSTASSSAYMAGYRRS